MKRKWMSHIIAILAFVGFIVLGLGSASGPKIAVGEASMLYFNANGGIGAVPGSETVEKGASITIPGGEKLSFGDAVFAGWYTISGSTVTNYNAGDSFTPPGGYITLYAKWETNDADLDSAIGLANKLVWLQNNAESGGNYIIEINNDETIALQTLRYLGKRNITITLRGVEANRVVTSATASVNYSTGSNATLFSVFPGVTLILDNNITLRGGGKIIDLSGASGEAQGGSLRMNNGSTVSSIPTTRGDTTRIAVSVGASCTFTMNGGTISHSGVGVEVWNEARFNMNGGTISDNNVGVWVNGWATNTLFTMNNGTITRNNTGVDSERAENFRSTGGKVSENRQNIRNQ